MTIQENAKFTVENVVSDYNFEDRKHGSVYYNYTYWEILAMIKHAYEIGAFSEGNARRYCYQMHCTFEEMMSA